MECERKRQACYILSAHNSYSPNCINCENSEGTLPVNWLLSSFRLSIRDNAACQNIIYGHGRCQHDLKLTESNQKTQLGRNRSLILVNVQIQVNCTRNNEIQDLVCVEGFQPQRHLSWNSPKFAISPTFVSIAPVILLSWRSRLTACNA